MPKNSALDGFLHNLRRAMLWHKGETDAELLAHYSRQGDGAAFDALTRRHGPMVLGVCRRVLRNDADAEDAFQATFLILIRKAGSIRSPDRLANWLFGVARKTALKAGSKSWARQAKERALGLLPEPQAVPNRDTGFLDEELKHLPEKYRLPIVICELEGRSLAEAARHLGWPQGTVATRLARGRDMLAKRLTRRGLTMAGAALAACFKESTAARASAATVNAIVKAATFAAAGKTVTSELIPAHVAALAEGVIRAMFMTKIKWAAFVILTVAGLIAGTEQALQRSTAQPAAKAEIAAEIAKPQGVVQAADAKKSPLGATGWGEAAGGIMIRVRAVKKEWRAIEKPELLVDLFNKAVGELAVPRLPTFEVEVDRTWHVPTIKGLVAGYYTVHKGEEHERFGVVSLDAAKWIIKTDENKDKLLVTETDLAKRLRLTPGKHTLRVACKLNGHRLISNPVEIEIVND